jgi:hypothetical protein
VIQKTFKQRIEEMKKDKLQVERQIARMEKLLLLEDTMDGYGVSSTEKEPEEEEEEEEPESDAAPLIEDEKEPVQVLTFSDTDSSSSGVTESDLGEDEAKLTQDEVGQNNLQLKELIRPGSPEFKRLRAPDKNKAQLEWRERARLLAKEKKEKEREDDVSEEESYKGKVSECVLE